METIQVVALIGCDNCGSSQVHPDECFCDPCLIAHFQKSVFRLQDPCDYDYLEPDFKAKLLKQYQARLAQLQARA